MKLTIEEALQKAIIAHKDGESQKAEGIYRSILKVEPNHPHANHNLGVLAVSFGKIDIAIPLFKIAIEKIPKLEQFWISYINAYIEKKDLKGANQALNDAEKVIELSRDNLNNLRSLLDVSKKSFDELSIYEKQEKGLFSNDKKLLTKNEKINDNKKILSNINKKGSPSNKQIKKLTKFYQQGRYNDAEKLALSIVEEFPYHQFSWKVLEASYKKNNKVLESIDANKKLIELDPKNIEAKKNLASMFYNIGKFNEAKIIYNEIVSLNPNNAEVLNNLGLCHKEMNDFKGAEKIFIKAIRLNPNIPGVYTNLSTIYQSLGRLREAEEEARKSLAINDKISEFHNNLGIILQQQGRADEAEESYREAINLKPEFITPKSNLGELLYSCKKYKEAILTLEGISESSSQLFILKSYYYLNDKDNFYKQLDLMIGKGEAGAIIGSLTSRAQIKFGVEKENIFVSKPLEHTVKIDLTENYNFNDIFIQNIYNFLDKEVFSYRHQTLLTNGEQTAGNFFLKEESYIKEIERIIRFEIDKYRSKFSNSREGFLINWPKDFYLKGWLINMTSGGKLDPHMHDNGWISGAVYINIPNKKELNSGNFVVTIDEKIISKDNNSNQEKNIDVKKISKMIDVRTGSLVLFPSSLMHYTIPFESDENRIVLAFDVVPK